MTHARRLVGDAIREARRARGWSQYDLALKTGVAQHHISRIESGTVGARLDTVERLLTVLGMHLDTRNDISPLQLAS